MSASTTIVELPTAMPDAGFAATGPIPIVSGTSVDRLAPHVRAALRRALHGRDWAVLEVGRALGPSVATGRRRLPDPVPAPPRLIAEFAPVLDALTGSERMTLLAAAVAIEPRTDVLLAATGVAIDDLLDGGSARYLRFVAGAFAFDDLALRAVVHHRATIAERTRAHRALAAAYDGARDVRSAAWHRALAALIGDASAVPVLIDAAHDALAEGRAELAQRIAREAASHAAREGERAKCRRLEALAAFACGHLELAVELAVRAREAVPSCAESDALAEAVVHWSTASPAHASHLLATLDAAFGIDLSSTPIARAMSACDHAWAAATSGDLARSSAVLASAADDLPLGAVPDGRAARLARRLALLVGESRLDELADEFDAHGGTGAGDSGARLRDRALRAALEGRTVDAAAFVTAALAEHDVDALPYLDVVDTLAASSARSTAMSAITRVAVSEPAERLRRELALTDERHVDALAAEALALPHPSAYSAACTALAAARALRRLGREEAAHAHYLVATEHFGAAGAAAWVTAVRHELGAPTPPPVPEPNGATSDPALAGAARQADAAASALLRRLSALTAREQEVVEAIADGLPNREVALRLCMSVRTVEVHLGRVFRKLGVASRVELALLVHGRRVRDTA